MWDITFNLITGQFSVKYGFFNLTNYIKIMANIWAKE